MGFIVDSIYKKKYIHRYDSLSYIKCFSASDFPGLISEPFDFMSGNNRLSGFFYSYPDCISDTLLIFCHGIGGGHLSYMVEIELLCRRGYRVLAYDNTGCCSSQGKSIRGITQSLADLDSALNVLKSNGSFSKYKKVFVIGHSWGGYAAGNIANYHSDLSGVVVISGCVSVKQAILSTLKKENNILDKYMLKKIISFEKRANPNYVMSSSLDAINNEKTRFFVAHSEDDGVFPFSYNAGYLQKNCVNRNVQFVIYKDRKHNPNYLPDARLYMEKVFGEYKKSVNQKKLRSDDEKKEFFSDTDWVRMTRQDDDFWDSVISFLSY